MPANAITNTKPWYQSRAVWGGVVAAVAGVAASFGIDINQASAVDLLVSVGSLVGGILAIYGRIKASTLIRSQR